MAACFASIGPAEPSRVRGCRVTHQIIGGMARIDIRAGGHPPPGRDERVPFLISAAELDDLRAHLDGIRADLVQAEHPQPERGEPTHG